MPIPSWLEAHVAEMAALSRRIDGWQTDREIRFLATAAAVLPPDLGDVLEIGCFRGKSTAVLAKSVVRAGGNHLSAVDPLLPRGKSPPGETPDTVLARFTSTLGEHDVADLVTLHRMKSQELALTWDQPLRFLFIDGDHSYDAVRQDFEGFARHLAPGAVIAFHDILNRVEGPVRVFCERVLASADFGPAGLCGSIGWAQRLDQSTDVTPFLPAKLRLFTRLGRVIPYVVMGRPYRARRRLRYKLRRWLVPHREIEPRKLAQTLQAHLPAPR